MPKILDAEIPPPDVWIGARVPAPMIVDDPGGPYRPLVTLWMELPSGLIVACAVDEPHAAGGSFAESLRRAMAAPMAGRPRRPPRVRVADLALGAELRAADLGVPVEIAPTPEIEEVLDGLHKSVQADVKEDSGHTYTDEGRIPAETVGALFRAAEFLHGIAPWKRITGEDVVRVDAPRLGLAGACVSILGNAGEVFGFALYESLAAFERFLEAADPSGDRRKLDLGSQILSLTFVRGADLPQGMRREVATHRWPVAGSKAYPDLERRDRDGFPLPPSPHDFLVATRVALAMASFFARRPADYDMWSDPVCESFGDDSGDPVRVTAPYEAAHLFEAPRPKVGRNDPCPCGSGRKYKKCHLGREESETTSPGGGARAEAPTALSQGIGAPLHAMDQALVQRMERFADGRLGGRNWRHIGRGLDAIGPALLGPWAVYGEPRDAGRTIADWFAEEERPRLRPAERQWLEAQGSSWLSVWEVTANEPGVKATLTDLLTGEERIVHETSATRTLGHRDALLARVVTLGAISVLVGTHPRPLPPYFTDAVVTAMRRRVRRMRAEVPVEKLREPAAGRYLMKLWQDACAQLDERRHRLPELHNMDGDPLVLTEDRFELAVGHRTEFEARLGAEAGVRRGDGPGRFVFERQVSNREIRVLGNVRVADESVILETNSTARADALSARLGEVGGEALRHLERKQSDPSAELERSAPPRPHRAPTPEAAAVLREMKASHYATWTDEPLPGLGGATPRQAIRTRAGRRAVDLMLREMENLEGRGSREERFDFSEIRRKLGLPRS